MFTHHAPCCTQAANSNDDLGAVKALDQGDLCLYSEHLLRLRRQCRRSRFGNEVSDHFLRGYVDRVDLSNTAVLGYFSKSQMRAAIELRSLRSVWCDAAEVAVTVEAEWRSQGIGSALMLSALGMSQRLGIERIFLICDCLNRPMQRIAEKVHACMQFEDSDCLAQITVASLHACEGSAGRCAA
jgi:GNAT superfamily N-acetyltransferase